MLTTIRTIRLCGIEAVPAVVEVEVFDNSIGIHLIGLHSEETRCSLLRTMTALQAKGFRIPGKKVVINIAPSDSSKDAVSYDLPIALTLAAASGQVTLPDVGKYVVVGELGLDGSVRPVPGAVQAVEYARSAGMKCIIPRGNAVEVTRVFGDGVPVFAVGSLQDALDVFGGSYTRSAHEIAEEYYGRVQSVPPVGAEAWNRLAGLDMACRALEIAAAGGHHMLLSGPDGGVRTLVSEALVHLLPPASDSEKLEIAKVHSAAGLGPDRSECLCERPYRPVLSDASLAYLFGGGSGSRLLPGAVSLASGGVLFLDDVVNSPRSVTESLRSVLEDRKVVLSRLHAKAEFPADFQLVLGMAPCPDSYGAERRKAYMSRLPGALLDRVGIQLAVHSPESGASGPAEPIGSVRDRVFAARKRQEVRYAGLDYSTNDRVPSRELERFCPMEPGCDGLIGKLITGLGLSARAYSWILRIARTIADLEGSELLKAGHLSEAASFRFLDRIRQGDESAAATA